ncbi:aminotransferase class I/II-fold pyridoxal phosphate-dependent enzyme|uniref:Aminotransferase n=1 Tax=Dendrosporobacter quercicolus TaxID=146817 RepID=A0A1G9LZU2_9FIRM|nr:aminotransferase class I/II-fold pyridoxal phosphate-dependent enzyme [Dendrosporobacter quercicolus]NSL46868.1 aminotransferase class I/II-fold pyridoxal phosphate-dependent enzyme [Dendrosporobacter quercicolus DSM 1736]SDL67466.1 LL-diaminopimelate aminotransferase apoenzyme [Dendrosporobacter quercicolus]
MVEQSLRLQGLSSAVFSQVDEMRRVELSRGKDVITLSIGSPDMAPAPHIIQALTTAAADAGNYGYTLSKGLPEFSQAVADWYRQKFGVCLDAASEIHSLIGSQEGLAHISLCLTNPGDIILIPDPGYPIYSAGPLMADAKLYSMPLTGDHDFLPDLAAIPESVLEQAKIMILNYPNNPLAAVATREFFREVVDYAKRYRFIVCHDFAYSDLVFDGYKPDSFLSVPGAKEVGVEFNSLSKTYNMAGCRVGYIVGNAAVIELLGRLKSNFDYGIFAPLQQAAIAALTGPQQCVADTAATYQRRRDIIIEGLKDIGWRIDKPKASMYIWAPVPTRQSSIEFAADLLRQAGIAAIPGVAFGRFGEGFIRFALVQPEPRLIEAVNRIKHWLG